MRLNVKCQVLFQATCNHCRILYYIVTGTIEFPFKTVVVVEVLLLLLAVLVLLIVPVLVAAVAVTAAAVLVVMVVEVVMAVVVSKSEIHHSFKLSAISNIHILYCSTMIF